mgnify:CR=1 FL=1
MRAKAAKKRRCLGCRIVPMTLGGESMGSSPLLEPIDRCDRPLFGICGPANVVSLVVCALPCDILSHVDCSDQPVEECALGSHPGPRHCLYVRADGFRVRSSPHGPSPRCLRGWHQAASAMPQRLHSTRGRFRSGCCGRCWCLFRPRQKCLYRRRLWNSATDLQSVPLNHLGTRPVNRSMI